jgi:hypothetical protein
MGNDIRVYFVDEDEFFNQPLIRMDDRMITAAERAKSLWQESPHAVAEILGYSVGKKQNGFWFVASFPNARSYSHDIGEIAGYLAENLSQRLRHPAWEGEWSGDPTTYISNDVGDFPADINLFFRQYFSVPGCQFLTRQEFEEFMTGAQAWAQTLSDQVKDGYYFREIWQEIFNAYEQASPNLVLLHHQV